MNVRSIVYTLSVIALLSCQGVHAKEYFTIKNTIYENAVPITEKAKNTIRQFIQEFADKTIEELICNLEKFDSMREEVQNLELLNVLCFVFSEADLRNNVQKIIDTESKSRFFLMMLDIELTKAKNEGKLENYVTQFALALGVKEGLLYNFIDEANFIGLVQYLLDSPLKT